MGIEFAEKIIDGMVDSDGHCGERGLSAKQFAVLSRYLDEHESERVGGWSGDYSHKTFWSTDFEGNIGRYHVVLNEYMHFNPRYTVVGIDLRPRDEYEAELRFKEALRFEGSDWVGEPKQRLDMELTLMRVCSYEREAYSHGTETVRVYTLADSDGNCYVWKTTCWLDCGDGDGYVQAKPGDRVAMRATVKEHSEYRGVRQTVITRPKVMSIWSAAA